MPRPCEDVIVISDAEEGELLEVDDDDDPLDPLNPLDPLDLPDSLEREEGEIPDDDVHTPWFPFGENNINERKKIETPSRLVVFNKPIIPPSKLKYSMYQAARKTFKYSKKQCRSNVKKTYLLNRFHVTPEAKIRRKHRKKDDSSESDSEQPVKKLTSLAISRKSNNSSLRSRLSYMMKCSSIDYKSNNCKNWDIIDNNSKLDSTQNLNRIKNDHIQISPNSTKDSDNSSLRNNDVSDDDLDILRELALKSKTQRISKQKVYDNLKENENKNNENSAVHSVDVDKELEELRLDALKSAMLKKAFKRKRIKNDEKRREKKEKKTISPYELEQHIEDQSHINPSALLPISLENDEGNLMYDYSLYNSFKYPYMDYNLNKGYEEHITHLDNANKENNEIKENNILEEEEDENSLRSRLLLEMQNKKNLKIAPSPSNHETNIQNSDSNLIIRLGGSDTESECEETKNLALMHKRLIDQNDFQRNLEYFLKEARQSATDKLNYEISKTENSSISSENNEAILINKTQLLDRLAKLEQIKSARKEVLKKLQRKAFPLRKNSVSSQNGDATIKNSKRILRPSLLINRRLSVSAVNKTSVMQSDNGQRALEQQLILIRKKIVQQNVFLKRMQNDVKILQKKRDALTVQIRSATLALRGTESTINSNQQSLQKAFQQLTVLQKHHMILQNRCLKNSSKVAAQPIILVNNKVKENRILQDENPVQRISKIHEKIVISKIGDFARTKNIENSVSDPKKVTYILENVKKSSVEDASNKTSKRTESYIVANNVINSTSLVIPILRDTKTENSVITFTEYETPLTGIKSDQNWIGDPQAILCPFDVSGSCKDTLCNYYHPKISKT